MAGVLGGPLGFGVVDEELAVRRYPGRFLLARNTRRGWWVTCHDGWIGLRSVPVNKLAVA